jgi:hypothetical protein
MEILVNYISFTRINVLYLAYLKHESKAIPLKAFTGHEDYRSLRLPDLKTIGT